MARSEGPCKGRATYMSVLMSTQVGAATRMDTEMWVEHRDVGRMVGLTLWARWVNE